MQPSNSAKLVEILRQDIVGGSFQPGGRIPSQTELAERFGVAGMTIQKVLKRLGREGFIEARSRAGTFVAEKPPHLNQYALVFWNAPHDYFAEVNWSRYFQALTQEAVRFESETGRRILQFHGIDCHVNGADCQRLISNIKSQQLAGLIFANAPLLIKGSPILDLPDMPRVAIESFSFYPQVHSVTFDNASWLEKALDYFASLGRRRVAAIVFGHLTPKFDAALQAGLAARGMASCSRWLQFVSMTNPGGARHAVELLMNDRERPDALLIDDDNFVEHALAGLVAAGIRVPEDVAVVGHANFPIAPAKPLDAQLLGFDIGATLRTCIGIIDRWRQGSNPPAITMLPALWENEVKKTHMESVNVARASRP